MTGTFAVHDVARFVGDRPRSFVRVACGRIVGFARAILEAHKLGVVEGHHELPWTAEYHRDAVRVYATSLPALYQLCVRDLFRDSAEVMAGETVPGHLVEDWMIVRSYMISAGSAMSAHYAALASVRSKPDVSSSGEFAIGESLPMVIRFDLLAQLTTSEGARRLERAAVTVRDHVELSLPALDDVERQMLIQLNAGTAIVDMAADLGYSERSMYRLLAQLWHKLGVPDRKEGIRRAAEGGLLD